MSAAHASALAQLHILCTTATGAHTSAISDAWGTRFRFGHASIARTFQPARIAEMSRNDHMMTQPVLGNAKDAACQHPTRDASTATTSLVNDAEAKATIDAAPTPAIQVVTLAHIQIKLVGRPTGLWQGSASVGGDVFGASTPRTQLTVASADPKDATANVLVANASPMALYW